MPTSPSVEDKTKILVVEDDSFLAGMYVTKLQLEHFNVALAGDGRLGLEKAKKMLPDLILLDILLPKMDGYEVLAELKKTPATAKIPVILLTNLGQKQDVLKGLSLGATDYLIKAHFMPSEVVDKIKQILQR